MSASSPQRTIRQRQATAYHESGHALIAWRSCVPFREVSIVANYAEGYAGYVESPWAIFQTEDLFARDKRCRGCGAAIGIDQAEEDYELRTEEDFAFINIRVALAGAEASGILRGRRDLATARFDLVMVGEITAATWPNWAPETARSVIHGLRLSVRDQLRAEWHCVSALAEALLKRDHVSEAEAIAVMREARDAKWQSGAARAHDGLPPPRDG